MDVNAQKVPYKTWRNRRGSVLTIVMVAVIAAPLWAIQKAPTGKGLEFEAASIKPNKSVDVGGANINLGRPGGRVTISKFSLRMLMGQAFDLHSLSDALNSIIGVPNWGDSEHFDIEAVAEGSPGISEKRLMLQSLLADRFKLTFHYESKQRPVYALMTVKPGKLGPQLRPPTDATTCEALSTGRTERSSVHSGSGAAKISPSAAAMSALQEYSCGRVVGGLLPKEINLFWSGGRSVTLATIAASLGDMDLFDRPLLDRTNVRGTFDFTVEWNTPTQNLSPDIPNDASKVSLIEALQEQLGLKLVPQTAPVDVLVIDHVERPTPD
jgi:uncharacterized protein (TIGR03435 family)